MRPLSQVRSASRQAQDYVGTLEAMQSGLLAGGFAVLAMQAGYGLSQQRLAAELGAGIGDIATAHVISAGEGGRYEPKLSATVPYKDLLKNLSLGFDYSQPLNDKMYHQVLDHIERSGFKVIGGAEAENLALEKRAKAYIEIPRGGGPGTAVIPPNAPAAAILEELFHLEQYRASGGSGLGRIQLRQMEIEAQKFFIELGGALGGLSLR